MSEIVDIGFKGSMGIDGFTTGDRFSPLQYNPIVLLDGNRNVLEGVSPDDNAENNDNVRRWSDYSDNDNHADQSTASKQPTYKTAIINNNAVVRFDGSSDVLELPVLGLTNHTIFIVFNLETIGKKHTIISDLWDAGGAVFGDDGVKVDFDNTGNTIRYILKNSGATVSHTFSFTTIDDYQVLELVHDTTGGVGASTTKAILNGISKIDISDDNPVGASSQTPYLGAQSESGSLMSFNGLQGDLPYLAIYNTVLSDDPREEIRNYLTNRYL